MISDKAMESIQRILDEPSDSFLALARASRLDPASGWRGADLRGVEFGEDDLTGYRFRRALLHGADFSRARNLSRAMFDDAAWDATTKWPAGFGMPASRIRPPLTPLAQWREPVPGLPEDAWPDMVTLPAGVFTMGAPKRERNSDDDERPQREVTVPRPFALGRVVVTFAQWDAARAAGAELPNPEDEGWGRGDRPVIRVSWDAAQAYCAWLNARLGLRAGTYRLPSEAEWEYACRAGTTTPFSFGATISPSQVNYDGNYTYGKSKKGEYRQRTVSVGSLPANDWGLHEMHGNVFEWCEDLFGDYPDHATDSRPLTPAESTLRVLRGGSWNNLPRYCRSAFRSRYRPVIRDYWSGVRLARTLF